MPNVTIYLTDDEYLCFIQLSEEEQSKVRQNAKKELLK